MVYCCLVASKTNMVLALSLIEIVCCASHLSGSLVVLGENSI
jgi:hypothetical protein